MIIRIFAVITMLVGLSQSAPLNANPYDSRIPTRADRYTYTAKVLRVIDGDTIEADIDLGFHTWRRAERLRLARIDAPETRGDSRERGLAAKKWLQELIEDKWLIVRTVADKRGRDSRGSFGRYLVELFYEGKNLNDELVRAGHAEYRE